MNPETLEEHFRELILLLCPGSKWQANVDDPETEASRQLLNQQTYKMAYEQHMPFFGAARNAIMKSEMADLNKLARLADEDIFLELDETVQHESFTDAEDEAESAEPTRNQKRKRDPKYRLSKTSTKSTTVCTIPKLLNDTAYWQQMRQLTQGQREYFDHMLHALRYKSDEQLLLLITGDAGTNKSKLLHSLFQMVTNKYNARDGCIDRPKALVMSWTASTARNVIGMTVHSALGLQLGGAFTFLSCERLNQERTAYADIKVIFIDEVSLINHESLFSIHRALTQIFGTHHDVEFGGKHMI